MSDVIGGVEWVISTHTEKKNKHEKSVVNMSLGGGMSITLNRTVNAAADAGIFFVVAAGNDNSDACFSSPASAEKVITVGATDRNDNMAFFSNIGKCVDIFAPGHEILSTWNNGQHSTNTISGTSMASPHVAGVVASLISREKYAHITPKISTSYFLTWQQRIFYIFPTIALLIILFLMM